MTPYHFSGQMAVSQAATRGFIRRVKFLRENRSRKSGTGFTLVELIVAVGLFSLIMLLASGAYLMMISLNRQAQNISTGINNLAFALETMTRNIRSGTEYSCGAQGDDCNGGTSFSFTNVEGVTVTYSLSGTSLQQRVGSAQGRLTDSSVVITSLKFYAYGAKPFSQNNNIEQARVHIVMSGTVSSGENKAPQAFAIETGATMRGSDL